MGLMEIITLGVQATLMKGGAAPPDPALYEQQKSDCHLRSAHNLLHLCQINGGVFIKVGQHIGNDCIQQSNV